MKKNGSVHFRPLGERIFVRPVEWEDTTVGGIYLPETGREMPKKGRVQAIGPDVRLVKVGDEVLFERYAGNKLMVGDVEYVVIKQEELMGVYE